MTPVRLTLWVLGGLIAAGWLAVISGLYVLLPFDWLGNDSADAPATAQVNTGLVNFDLTIVNDRDPITGSAGGMAVADGGILVARQKDGALWYYDTVKDTLSVLPYLLPPLDEETLPERFPTGRQLRPSDMRYHDVEIVPDQDGGERLLVTYNHYDLDGGCFVMRLDAADLPESWRETDGGEAPLVWRSLFTTEPCLLPSDDRNTFSGNQAGGRIVGSPDGSVLFTTGDFEFDDNGRKVPAVSQVDGSTLGRVLRLDPETGAVTEVSRGHRNPQGLALDGSGNIWVAEHGPMGGDELNLIREGADYGWPSVSLGVFYTDAASDAKSWPANPRQGRHEGFEPPVHAWVPSIAPSSMAHARNLDPRWDGDLIVATLISGSLHRLRLDDDAVLYDETIPLGRRIRDIVVAGGRIYLLFDDGQFGYMVPHEMVAMTDGPFDTGDAIYAAGCVECHSGAGMPRLAGIVGSPVAGQAGVSYSESLDRKDGTWTRDSLATFLRDPAAFAPGTTMPDPNLSEDRLTQVLDELEALRP